MKREINPLMIGVVGFLVMLLLLALIFFSPSHSTEVNEEKQLNKTIIVSCEDLTGLERDQCFFSASAQYNELVLCDEIQSEEVKRSCLIEYYGENKPEACGDLELESERFDCFLLAGSFFNDSSYCMKIPESNVRWSQCITLVAQYSISDIECSLIDDKDMRLYCYAGALKNESFCSEMVDEFHRMRCRDCVEKNGCGFPGVPWGMKIRIW